MKYAQPQTADKVKIILEIYLNRHALKRIELAKGIGCAPSQVTSWMSGRFFVLPMWACKIEKFTKGEIKAANLVLKNY